MFVSLLAQGQAKVKGPDSDCWRGSRGLVTHFIKANPPVENHVVGLTLQCRRTTEADDFWALTHVWKGTKNTKSSGNK